MTTFWTVFFTFLIGALALRIGFDDVWERLYGAQEPDQASNTLMNYLLLAALLITLCAGLRTYLP